MRDISARELKGHNILTVERFWDNTRWMIEFSVLRSSTAYGSPGEEMRLFLTEDGYQAALQSQQRQEIKAAVKAGIKEGLESLSGKIPGLVDIHVNIDALPSSNADLMLDTTFESAEALKGYSTHPAHVAVADSKVRPYYKNRVCLDYEV